MNVGMVVCGMCVVCWVCVGGCVCGWGNVALTIHRLGYEPCLLGLEDWSYI